MMMFSMALPGMVQEADEVVDQAPSCHCGAGTSVQRWTEEEECVLLDAVSATGNSKWDKQRNRNLWWGRCSFLGVIRERMSFKMMR
jgi:hypothetical protein